MATRKELRAAITEARGRVQRAIVESAPEWNTPGAATEGEEAWSPRQAMEHLVGAEVRQASNISLACGYPPLQAEPPELPAAADAAQQYALAMQKADSILQYVTDEDLLKVVPEGRMAGRSVEDLMQTMARHANEHADQALATAR
ncbi:MAG: hypothetical protein GEU28_08010 [Dehalococcoidia bacterium]|nr:hypothetical protein [Dehalococcoidia bacterium]